MKFPKCGQKIGRPSQKAKSHVIGIKSAPIWLHTHNLKKYQEINHIVTLVRTTVVLLGLHRTFDKAKQKKSSSLVTFHMAPTYDVKF